MPKIDYDGVKVKINERISTETDNIDDNANEYNTDTTMITRTVTLIKNDFCQESKSLPGSPVNKHRRRLLRRSEHPNSPEPLLQSPHNTNVFHFCLLLLSC